MLRSCSEATPAASIMSIQGRKRWRELTTHPKDFLLDGWDVAAWEERLDGDKKLTRTSCRTAPELLKGNASGGPVVLEDRCRRTVATLETYGLLPSLGIRLQARCGYLQTGEGERPVKETKC